jgi:hypothetical protein
MTGKDAKALAGGDGKVGAGNYVALASTHYRSGGSLESGLPTSKTGGGKECGKGQGAYCGNGGIPFPDITNLKITKKGHGMQSLSDGSSKCALITESREDILTSWYSGLASYVVGTWPGGNAPGGIEQSKSPSVFVWGWAANDLAGDIALNKGDQKRADKNKFYQQTNPHGGPRNWGPSSRHPNVVQHGYGDGRANAVNVQIDRNAYLALITRNGREVPQENP